MRNRFALLLTVAVTTAQAAELEAKVLRLIPAAPRQVFGMELERYRASAISEFISPVMPYDRLVMNPSWRRITYVESAEGGLAIFQGSTSTLARPEPETETTKAMGIDVVTLEAAWSLAVLDEDTAIAGNTAAVLVALAAWKTPAEPDALSAKWKELSAAYDMWFYLHQPLQGAPFGLHPGESKHQQKLANAVSDVSGGFRTGGINSFQIEATSETAEDALTLAGLARWMPGFAAGEHGPQATLVSAIEELDTHASGLKATARFVISDRILRDLLEQRNGASRPK